MGIRKESYQLPVTDNVEELIVELNRILRSIEDRLDKLEGGRTGIFVTHPWEQEYAKVRK